MFLNQDFMTRKQGEIDAIRLTLHEANKAENNKELIKRLDYIQRLARALRASLELAYSVYVRLSKEFESFHFLCSAG